MFNDFKNWKNEVNVEDLEKIDMTVNEFDELIVKIVNYCEACGDIKYLTPSIDEGRIYVNINTKFNFHAFAHSLSERVGLKYRTNKKTRSIALLL